MASVVSVSYTHLRAHETRGNLVCRLLLEKKGNKKIEFWGNSMIIDPSGEIIGELGNKKEEILIREIDFKKIDTTREHWPFLRDRRIDAYRGLMNNPKDE